MWVELTKVASGQENEWERRAQDETGHGWLKAKKTRENTVLLPDRQTDRSSRGAFPRRSQHSGGHKRSAQDSPRANVEDQWEIKWHL